MNFLKRFKSLPAGARQTVSVGIILALVVALPLFVWALVNLNFNQKEKAASGEPVCVINPTEMTVRLVHIDNSSPVKLDYEIAMRNNDTENCAPSFYTMEVMPPTGWLGSFYTNSFQLVPGSSYGDNHLTLTIPAGFNNWPQTFTISFGSVPSGHRGNTTIAYDARTCIHNPYGISVTPATKSGVPGSTQRYEVSVSNNDFNCAPLISNLIVDKPSNWTAEFSTSTFTLAPNHTYQAYLDVTSPTSNYLYGNQPIAVRVSTTAGTSESKTVIYNLINSTPSPTPTIVPTATPTEVPIGGPEGEPNSCGGTCGSNYNCKANLYCYQGFCRNPICSDDTDCNCSTEATAKPTVKPIGGTTKSPSTTSPRRTASAKASTRPTSAGGISKGLLELIETENTDGTDEVLPTAPENQFFTKYAIYIFAGFVLVAVTSIVIALKKKRDDNIPHILPPTNI